MSILRVSTFARLFRALSPCIGESTNSITKIRFGECTGYRHYATAIKLKADSQNIVSSGLADITGFENVYLHDMTWEKVDRWWNRTALVCGETGRSYTYGQMRKACSKLATSLRKNNLLPGDTIAVILPNIPEFVIILLAANEAGLQTTLINPAYTVYEIKRQLENADAKAVFTFPAKYTEIKASIEQNSKIKLPIIMANDGTGDVSISGTIKLHDLMRDDIVDFSVNEKTGISYKDTVLLPFSSGTTGLPKAVELTHRNVVTNVLQATVLTSGSDDTEHDQDIIPLILPLYHCYGLIVIMYLHLRMGAKLVCMPKFSLEKFIKLLEDHRFTMLHAVPPIIQMMAYNERITPRHVASMKTILSGAAPLGEESIAMFQNRVSDAVSFVQGYGMTELSPLVTLGIAGSPLASSGYLVPSTQMRIVGKQQDNLGPREVGEIYLRGPQVMKGYYKNPKATADSMDGDWYKSGDIGYYTEDGLYIQGRTKEMIKVQAYQVAPVELEEVIRGYDKIQDVAVIGVAHEKYGEIPKAFVVPKSGIKIDEEELKQFVAERTAKYKHLGYVQVVESIPKTASGKILRKDLKKM